MSRTAVSQTNFGRGLNLVDTPGLVEFPYAVDCLNATFTRRGAVRQRGGYAAFSGTLTNTPDSLGEFTKSDGTKRLLVGNSTRIDVLDTTGASVANTTAPTASPHFFQRFGGPTIEAIYIANGTDQVRRYDTSGGFTTPGGLAGQTGKFLCVTPTSNRLIVARESGTTGGNNPSSVNFSDAGAPETFNSGWIDLDPGDGQAIMGLVAYEGSVLIFKSGKVFAHWGESVDSTGLPVFQVRKADATRGLVASRALAVGEAGVYFLARDGVYRTSGGSSECVSSLIEPFFSGDPSIYFRSQPINHGSIDKAAMAYHDHRIYLAVPTGSSDTNDRVLVYDERTEWWSMYDLPAAALLSFAISSQPELVFARAATSKTIARHKTGRITYPADDMTSSGSGGVAIISRWRSGWTDLGSPNEKHIHGTELYATGAATVRRYKDFNFTDAIDGLSQAITFTTEDSLWDDMTWATDPWGPTATATRKLHQKGYGATYLSLDVSNSTINQSWELNVANFLVTNEGPPGMKHT